MYLARTALIGDTFQICLYVNTTLKYSLRQEELTVTHVDYEALWLEIQCNGQSNLVCGVVYTYPNGNLENFMHYIKTTNEKIHGENKLWNQTNY